MDKLGYYSNKKTPSALVLFALKRVDGVFSAVILA